MQLSNLLQPSAVKVLANVTSKKRLFQDLGDIAHSAYGLDATQTVDALQERESLGPTGVGHGVALPHARLHGLSSVIGVFLRLEKALEFDAVDRQPVDLIFALFAPNDSGGRASQGACPGVAYDAQRGDLREAARQYRPVRSPCRPHRGAGRASGLICQPHPPRYKYGGLGPPYFISPDRGARAAY